MGQSRVKYLGHVVSKEGVEADLPKLQAIIYSPIPKNVKQLRGFLGLTCYYRKFIPDYGGIIQPLYNLTKKYNFQWDNTSIVAFDKLKNTMASPQVLALTNFSKPL